MRVLGYDDVLRLMPLAECIEWMAAALGGFARGSGVQPMRTVIRLPDGTGSLYTMPAATASPPALAVKMVTIFPGNRERGRATHAGVLVVFSTETGEPLAVMDASAVTEVRTAGVSALATRLLAREDAGDLAILGSGVQARSHLRAMRAVRRIRRARAWSPTRARLEAFVAEASTPELRIEATASAHDAVAGADLVCVATSARAPVLQGAWLGAGAHVNAIGASMPDARELDTAAIAGARVYVDLRAAALAEAGDLVIAMREGAITEQHIQAELGEVVAGLAQGRRTREEVTVFKSVGLAIEDAAAAHHVHTRAVRQGLGSVVPLHTGTGE